MCTVDLKSKQINLLLFLLITSYLFFLSSATRPGKQQADLDASPSHPAKDRPNKAFTKENAHLHNSVQCDHITFLFRALIFDLDLEKWQIPCQERCKTRTKKFKEALQSSDPGAYVDLCQFSDGVSLTLLGWGALPRMIPTHELIQKAGFSCLRAHSVAQSCPNSERGFSQLRSPCACDMSLHFIAFRSGWIAHFMTDAEPTRAWPKPSFFRTFCSLDEIQIRLLRKFGPIAESRLDGPKIRSTPIASCAESGMLLGMSADGFKTEVLPNNVPTSIITESHASWWRNKYAEGSGETSGSSDASRNSQSITRTGQLQAVLIGDGISTRCPWEHLDDMSYVNPAASYGKSAWPQDLPSSSKICETSQSNGAFAKLKAVATAIQKRARNVDELTQMVMAQPRKTRAIQLTEAGSAQAESAVRPIAVKIEEPSTDASAELPEPKEEPDGNPASSKKDEDQLGPFL